MPRALGILIILFLAIFALDVFEPGKTFTYYATALFMHLIPNFILAAILILAWKKETIGGILFILVALAFTMLFKTYKEGSSFFVVSVPVFIIGILFIIDNMIYMKKKT